MVVLVVLDRTIGVVHLDYLEALYWISGDLVR